MAFGNLESFVKAILIVSILSISMSPVFFSTLPSTVATKLNLTAVNATNNLNNLVFKQTNNTALCGTPTGCNPQNSTGGVYAQANLFSAFAFVLNGFGYLVSTLINTPYIMSIWIGEAVSIMAFPISTTAMIEAMLPAFISFIIIIVCVSALMKYPMRSG